MTSQEELAAPSTATTGVAPLLIDGQLVDPGRSYESINPATEEVVGLAADANLEDAEAAIAAARKAFDTTTWSTDRDLRVRCLEQLHAALEANKEELRELTIQEVGSPRQITYAAQLEQPIQSIKYYADLLKGYEFTEELGNTEFRGQQHRRWIEREAAGVVAAIIAYNYPNQLALAKLGPALAAGCTVILKGSPDTPLVSSFLGRLIKEHTDIPDGVVNVLTGRSIEVGQVLTTDPRVDLITFTGSTATGRAIMSAASATVKKVFLELGGKSAMIVTDDADQAMASMIAAFMICSHAGQGCAITSRLLVPRHQHDEIVAQVVAMIGNVKVGDPSDKSTFMGPVINSTQRDKIHGLVERAVKDGATLAFGGTKQDGPGFFYSPTVLSNVDPDSEIAQDEVFGPVLAIIPFEDDDDAVRIANNSIFGLSGGVFSGDDDRALAIARRVRAGTFGINGGNYFSPDVPFGGYKQSGIGREMGKQGFEEFLETKALAVVLK